MVAHAPAWVACCPEDPSRVYGFVVADQRTRPALMHWLWVRRDFRRLGIGTRLVAQVLCESPEKLSPTSWTRELEWFRASRAELFQAPRHDLSSLRHMPRAHTEVPDAPEAL
jgi:GNAT superfamily N-acetyltransferase